MALGKKTGGRVKGTLNKSTAEIKALAMEHAPSAIKELARLATSAESEAARVAAIRELLDRGIGKAIQEIVSTNTTKVEHSIDYSGLSTDDLAALISLATKAALPDQSDGRSEGIGAALPQLLHKPSVARH